MQENVVIKIETEFMRDLIAELLHDALQKQKGYCVDFRIHALQAVNDNEKIKVHLELDAETDSKELEKSCKDSFFLKSLVEGALKLLGNVFAAKMGYHFIENMIEKSLKKNIKIKIEINKVELKEKDKNVRVFLDADVKMKEKDLEKSLENFDLI